ncbi:MAG: hypothetical protein ACRCV0_00350 [Brevinema sp.]
MKFYLLLIILLFGACADKQTLSHTKSENQAESVSLETTVESSTNKVISNSSAVNFISRTNIADQIHTMSREEINSLTSDEISTLSYSLNSIEIRDRLVEVESLKRHPAINTIFYQIYNDPIIFQDYYIGIIETELENRDTNMSYVYISNISVSQKLFQEASTKTLYTQNIEYLCDKLQISIPYELYYDSNFIIKSYFSNTNQETLKEAPVLYIYNNSWSTNNIGYRYFKSFENFQYLFFEEDQLAH